MAAERLLTETLRDVAAALDEIAAPSMIIGGVAVIAAGVPRETIDVDATISGRDSSIESVLDVFARHSIIPRIEDAVAFARERPDIERLLALHGKEMDIQRVRDLVSEIAIALDDPDRIAAFDAILTRTGNYRS